GEKEEGEGLVSVRKRGTGDLGSVTIAEFAKMIENQVNEEQKVEY
ncbi:MAG: His/Gly/Thr/Pro-type tRNA ligase C-terminal domain-containing protein, partial [Bacteroidales bacterium]|nr:His/Gly/Thr/Pro-type tRNA ligase C-terminal domain-containing protein [Bacteroidales bacterium]